MLDSIVSKIQYDFNMTSIMTGIVWYLSKKYVSKIRHKNAEKEKKQYIYVTSMLHLFLKNHNKNT